MSRSEDIDGIAEIDPIQFKAERPQRIAALIKKSQFECEAHEVLRVEISANGKDWQAFDSLSKCCDEMRWNYPAAKKAMMSRFSYRGFTIRLEKKNEL